VPPGAIGIGRGRQRNIEGWVERRRAGTASAAAARRAHAENGGQGIGDDEDTSARGEVK
jgi:bifunctional UDP-N-acetylglucosamine pyrophosphorylase/glucosamine-1-phosphate N-acetyltransferase